MTGMKSASKGTFQISVVKTINMAIITFKIWYKIQSKTMEDLTKVKLVKYLQFIYVCHFHSLASQTYTSMVQNHVQHMQNFMSIWMCPGLKLAIDNERVQHVSSCYHDPYNTCLAYGYECSNKAVELIKCFQNLTNEYLTL